jgi:hypothetical protein
MLTVRWRKNVEFVFVTAVLILILFGDSALANKRESGNAKSKRSGLQSQRLSRAKRRTSRPVRNVRREPRVRKSRLSRRSNLSKAVKASVRQSKKAAPGKQPNKTTSSPSSTDKHGKIITRTCIYPPLPRPRNFRRHRKRVSFETRKRRSFDTRERISMTHYYKEPPRGHHILKPKIKDQSPESTLKGKKDGPEK